MLLLPITLLTLLPTALLAAPTGGNNEKRAPLVQARFPSRVLPGKYIVKLKDGSSDAALNKALGSHRTGQIYRIRGFKGFAGELDANALNEIRKLPEVEYVEEDALVTIQAITSQINAPWNLARISSHTPGTTVYKYDSSAGANTCSYIIDTGIHVAHPEFGGRAVWGANLIDSSNTDGNGHGTAVAGVVGAVTYGVAKKTTLIAVKVLDTSGSGSISGVIAGMNFVTTDRATRSCPNGTVANMAIGGAYSQAMNAAARNLINSGVFLAVAAGGSGADAGGSSPGSEPLACTVGASTAADSVASSSNYGPLLDIYAPGQNIKTTWVGGGTNNLSGTSFASAHIAGLGAYLLRLHGAMAGSALCAYMQEIATENVLTGVPAGTPNLLAYNGWDL